MATAGVGLQGLWVELLTPLTEDLFIHHAKLSTHVQTLGAKGIQGVVMHHHPLYAFGTQGLHMGGQFGVVNKKVFGQRGQQLDP